MSAEQAIRPDPKVIMRDPIHLAAFGFGTGLSPIMPGTIGTLVGIPLFLAMHWMPWPLYLMITALLFALGILLCSESARRLATHDHPGIVWDEIVGFLITMTPLLPDLLGGQVGAPLWFWVLAGFIAFRVFDIVKPPPIRQIDKNVHGGLGIMLDDAIAALFAAIVLVLLALPGLLFPAVTAV